MLAIDISQTGEALLTLGVVVAMFVLFVRETYPTEVVAIAGISLMLLLGLLPYDLALPVLSNPAPWTIAAMFIVFVRPNSCACLITLVRSNPAPHTPRIFAPEACACTRKEEKSVVSGNG